MIPDDPTGDELIEELRRAAIAAGQSLMVFARPLNPVNISTFLNQLYLAQKPKPHTVARVRALIAGAPLPPIEGANAARVRFGAPSEPDTLAERIAAEAREGAARLAAARRGGTKAALPARRSSGETRSATFGRPERPGMGRVDEGPPVPAERPIERVFVSCPRCGARDVALCGHRPPAAFAIPAGYATASALA